MFGNIAIALAVGLFVGVIVGMLGAGGGILSVPILVYVLGQDPHAAAAGSLVIVGLTALVSLFAQYRRVHFRDGIVFGTLSILGAWGGSRLNLLVDPDLLMYSFGILLLCVSAAMFHKAVRQLQKERGAEAEAAADSAGAASAADSRESRDSESALRTGDFSRIFVLIFCASLTGLLTGFFGVGGGFVVVPMLLLALRMPMREASATSLLIMVITSATGLLSRIGSDLAVDWGIVLIFAAASMLGGLLGGPVSRKAKNSTLTFIFAVLLIFVAVFSLLSVALQ